MRGLMPVKDEEGIALVAQPQAFQKRMRNGKNGHTSQIDVMIAYDLEEAVFHIKFSKGFIGTLPVPHDLSQRKSLQLLYIAVQDKRVALFQIVSLQNREKEIGVFDKVVAAAAVAYMQVAENDKPLLVGDGYERRGAIDPVQVGEYGLRFQFFQAVHDVVSDEGRNKLQLN
jgi:hypothetical protein